MPDETARTTNLGEHLTRVAGRVADKPAVVCLERRGSRTVATSRTFRDLDRAADRLAHAFRRLGIGKGVRTILMVRPSFELFATTFALLRTGAVPVMIDPGMGRQKLVDNLSSVEAGAFNRKDALGFVQRALEATKAAGTQVYFPTPEEYAQWASVRDKVWQEVADHFKGKVDLALANYIKGKYGR